MEFHEYVEQVIAFVRDNAAWAPPIVFALAFGESLAFISLLIPAWGALVAIGALIGPSGISFWPVWIAGALGAACGDWLSYWIGLKLEYSVAAYVAAVAPSRPDPARGGLHEEMGHSRHFHRAVFRTVACLGTADRRDFRDAVLALPIGEFLSAFVWAAVLLTLGDGISPSGCSGCLDGDEGAKKSAGILIPAVIEKWITGSRRGACHRAALRADPLAPAR